MENDGMVTLWVALAEMIGCDRIPSGEHLQHRLPLQTRHLCCRAVAADVVDAVAVVA